MVVKTRCFSKQRRRTITLLLSKQGNGSEDLLFGEKQGNGSEDPLFGEKQGNGSEFVWREAR